MSENYELIVIGAGPGGYVAAIKAAQLQKKVLVIENREVGGTCLNRGCIPTKALMHSTELLREMQGAAYYGINADNISYDISAINLRKDEVISKLKSGIEELFKSNKITFINASAKLINSTTVLVNDEFITGEKILIATGSTPALPPIEGIKCENVVTSDELLTTKNKLYKSLIIIGGGVIGVEFATIYNALGCEVTIIEACDKILPALDREISQNLSMILKKRGIKIYTSAKVEKISQGINCEFSYKDKLEVINAEGLLVAVGRKANTSGLFAEDFCIETKRGMIEVNDHFETSVKGVYAIGDVIKGGIQLAHVASAQGINAVCEMFGEKPTIDLKTVPSCIYTSPEIAAVGMSADEAKAMGIEVKTGKFIMSANGKTIIENADRGFIKVVFDAQTQVIIGAQMMCSRATDMISELSTAIVNKLTLAQLSQVIRPHPTFNEGVTEALEDVLGQSIHSAKRR